jgi:hypothetical protein
MWLERRLLEDFDLRLNRGGNGLKRRGKRNPPYHLLGVSSIRLIIIHHVLGKLGMKSTRKRREERVI